MSNTQAFQEYLTLVLYSWSAIAILCCVRVFVAKTGSGKEYLLPISTLSKIWAHPGTEKGKTVIHIEELVHLWRGGPTTLEEDVIRFDTPEAKGFYDRYIRDSKIFKSAHLQKDVCVRLLKLLEKTADCSSVSTCNIAGDPDGKAYEKNIIELLGTVSLLQHSINVGIKTVEILTKKGSRISIPNAMVAALGHDTGKLPMAREDCKAMEGSHPLAAGRPMASIKSFIALPHRNEILNAIKKHHKLPEDFLGKVLQEADRTARGMELEQIMSESETRAPVEWQEGDREKPNPGEIKKTAEIVGKQERVDTIPDIPEQITQKPTATRETVSAGPVPAQMEIFPPEKESPAENSEDKINVDAGMGAALMAITNMSSNPGQTLSSPGLVRKSTQPIPRMDIEDWWDAQDFLDEVKPYINKMFGTRYLAFSKGGFVYAQAKVLEEVIRKLAARAGRPEIADLDSVTNSQEINNMHSIMTTIVGKLRVHHDVIARELVREGYFGGKFIVLKKDGSQMSGYYTPFHIEAFGQTKEMEDAKPSIIRDIVDVSINRESRNSRL